MSADLLRQIPTQQTIYEGAGPVTVRALLEAKYGSAARSIAVSVVAREGSGEIVLSDTMGLSTDAVTMDAEGTLGRREWVFQFTRIVSISNGMAVEIYA